jgi:hypothetical protein
LEKVLKKSPSIVRILTYMDKCHDELGM